jgi:hypothetical protein
MQRQRTAVSHSHGPNITTISSYGMKFVAINAKVGTVNDRPGTAVPMFDQRLRAAGAVVAHSPDIVGRHRRHR